MAEKRDSQAAEPELIQDPQKKAEAEVENGLLQFDLGMSILDQALDPNYPEFKLRTSLLLQLQQQALRGISMYAGTFRPGGVEIKNSLHEPPENIMVPEFLHELCTYVNENFISKTPVHLASYVMWRLNWIHPFADGNGRTSRIASYIVLCAALGSRLPGTETIPDFIAGDYRKQYYDALEAADKIYKENNAINLSEMEKLLTELLSKQLLSVVNNATGNQTN